GAARRRAERHPRLDRAVERGRRRGDRADDLQRGPAAAPARRPGQRRRRSGAGAVQRAQGGRRLLRGPQGGRIAMTDLTRLTLKAALDGLRDKQFSSEELTGAFIANIEAANPALNAYVVQT